MNNGTGILSGPNPIFKTSASIGVFYIVLQQAGSIWYSYETGILVAVNPNLLNEREERIT